MESLFRLLQLNKLNELNEHNKLLRQQNVQSSHFNY